MTESVLEMAQRHVIEGEERIARQEALVRGLEHDRQSDTAIQARTLLMVMQETLQLSREHLEREKAK